MTDEQEHKRVERKEYERRQTNKLPYRQPLIWALKTGASTKGGVDVIQESLSGTGLLS